MSSPMLHFFARFEERQDIHIALLGFCEEEASNHVPKKEGTHIYNYI